jgi:hypothetical protein
MEPVEVRHELAQALGLDLIGPDRGSQLLNEVLPQAPSRWYLTGFLAPIEADEAQKADESAVEGVDELSDAGAGDDAATPEPAAARRALFPSSMGLSLLVPKEARELRVTARWGDYRPLYEPGQEKKDGAGDGRVVRGWQRAERVEELVLKLPASQKPTEREVPGSNGLGLVLAARPIRDIPAFEGMVPRGTRSVSLFLVNRRIPAPDEERDTAFVFQAALEVRCEAGFVARPNLRGLASDDWDERVADLQYRDVYEFAVGHGVATRAVLGERGACREVRTRWIPAAEVERIAPAPIEGVELRMEQLAQLPDAAAVREELSGLVTEYRAWIERQKANVPAGPKGRAQTGADLLARAGFAANRIEAGIEQFMDGKVLEAFRIANKVMATAARRRFGTMREKDPAAIDPRPGGRSSSPSC